MFENCFRYSAGGYLFVGSGGWGTPISRDERSEIRRRLTVQIALIFLAAILSALYGFYALAANFGREPAAAPSWLHDQSAVYAILVVLWLLTWLKAVAVWRFIARRLSDREPIIVEPDASNIFLPCTKPLRVAAFGFLMIAFATQGFGTGCFQFRGVGSCDYIKIELSQLKIAIPN
jgi:hypothetical protein